MTLQDIHKEFDEKMKVCKVCARKFPNFCQRHAPKVTIKKVKLYTEEQVKKLIKDCMPMKRKGGGARECGFNECWWRIEANLKARNINLD